MGCSHLEPHSKICCLEANHALCNPRILHGNKQNFGKVFNAAGLFPSDIHTKKSVFEIFKIIFVHLNWLNQLQEQINQ